LNSFTRHSPLEVLAGHLLGELLVAAFVGETLSRLGSLGAAVGGALPAGCGFLACPWVLAAR